MLLGGRQSEAQYPAAGMPSPARAVPLPMPIAGFARIDPEWSLPNLVGSWSATPTRTSSGWARLKIVSVRGQGPSRGLCYLNHIIEGDSLANRTVFMHSPSRRADTSSRRATRNHLLLNTWIDGLADPPSDAPSHLPASAPAPHLKRAGSAGSRLPRIPRHRPPMLSSRSPRPQALRSSCP